MKKSEESNLSKAKVPIFLFLLFVSIGIWRWTATGRIFYMLNFSYIGTSILIGAGLNIILKKKYKPWGRRITQVLIGAYMLGYVGFIASENMQIEGFFFYLLAGVFGGATLHYVIAKIFGVFFFNRAWCGWACWTAMVLDFLPWKKPKGRLKKLGLLRYLHFLISLLLVVGLIYLADYKQQYFATDITWLIIGNIFYFSSSIILAAVLKDNRAFCKYLCPIPVTQKIFANFTLMRQEIIKEKCTECKLCEKNCPMNIKLLSYAEIDKRVLSTECISCDTCHDVYPESAIKITFKIDSSIGQKELLNWRK